MNISARTVKAGPPLQCRQFLLTTLGVLSKDSEDIDVAFKNHGLFCQSHTAKTECRKNPEAGAPLQLQLQSARDFVRNGEHLDVVSKLESLGSQLSVDHTWACWMDWEPGGFMKPDRDQTSGHERHRKHGRR